MSYASLSPFVAAGLVILVCLAAFQSSQTFWAKGGTGGSASIFNRLDARLTLFEQRLAAPRSPSLSDGCYHVYLDVGANIGIQARKLFEPSLYPFKLNPAKITSQIEIYEQEFGKNRSCWREQVCVFMFEPNPLHHSRLRALESCYQSRGWRTKFFNVAASNRDDEFLHFLIDMNERGKEFWAARVITDPNAYAKVNNSIVVSVRSMDLTKFILEDVARRIVPAPRYADDLKPSVTMKLDIEGAEWVVLPKFLAKGAFCAVNRIIPEVHWGRPGETKDEHYFRHQVGAFIEALRGLNQTIGCLVPSLKQVDDESYGQDRSIPEGCEVFFANMQAEAAAMLNKVQHST